MTDWVEIKVARYDPERDCEPALVNYPVPMEHGATVMAALLYIYEHHDSTLAFRHSCRNKFCGLCAVDVDGKPRLACVSPLKNGSVIRPLQKIPAERDLIVDRRWIWSFLLRFDLFVSDAGEREWPQRLAVPEQHSRLAACTECLSCLAACPSFEFGRDDLGGPYHFLKLAQMHWDPRDHQDRRSQASELGIARCEGCRKCRCPLGIAIYRDAIAPLIALPA